MAFLNNTKYKEIYKASKDGNEQAAKILQALKKSMPQEDVDRLCDEYYGIGVEEPIVEAETTIVSEEEPPVEDVQTEEVMQEDTLPAQDITKILDGETDGLFDENEIDDLGFADFLKNKSRDGMRARKNAAYFKAYSPEDRASYMDGKINAYKEKFNGRFRDIDRKFGDNGKAIGLYIQNVNDSLDDGVELNMENASKAYDDFVGDDEVMKSFGRHWDDTDMIVVKDKLKSLMEQYGKQNVLAALNTLSSDNVSYRDFSNNKIDSEINRYSKSIENLFK